MSSAGRQILNDLNTVIESDPTDGVEDGDDTRRIEGDPRKKRAFGAGVPGRDSGASDGGAGSAGSTDPGTAGENASDG